VSGTPHLRFDPIEEAARQWSAHGWDDATPGMVFVTSIMRAQQILLSRVDEVLRRHDLTFARYELLMLLHFTREGALPLAKASARLQVHPTSVTNAVDRLEAADLVRRTPHPTDGRATLVEITDKGRSVALKATDELNSDVFRNPGLPRRRIDSLVSVLRDLRKRAGDFSQ
jgi:DNA-binding MarR family transcriptional regulator